MGRFTSISPFLNRFKMEILWLKRNHGIFISPWRRNKKAAVLHHLQACPEPFCSHTLSVKKQWRRRGTEMSSRSHFRSKKSMNDLHPCFFYLKNPINPLASAPTWLTVLTIWPAVSIILLKSICPFFFLNCDRKLWNCDGWWRLGRGEGYGCW